MSNLNFLHSGGNKVTLSAPTSDPSSNPNFKLPQSDGSAGQVLQTDGNGNLSWVTPGTATTNGITMADQWRLAGDNNKTNDQVIDSNWERTDTFFAQIGTGMSESSGVFTFPQTGIYFVLAQLQMNGSASYAGVSLEVSTNSGGSYGGFTYGYQNMSTVGGYHHLSLHGICDIANVSTHRLRMLAVNNASTQYSGNTNNYRCGMTFIRIGDT